MEFFSGFLDRKLRKILLKIFVQFTLLTRSFKILKIESNLVNLKYWAGNICRSQKIMFLAVNLFIYAKYKNISIHFFLIQILQNLSFNSLISLVLSYYMKIIWTQIMIPKMYDVMTCIYSLDFFFWLLCFRKIKFD